MKRDHRFGNVHIDVGNQHGEPYGLVSAAQKRQSGAPGRRRDQGAGYDEVWCVIDVEAPQPHGSLDRAMTLARESGIRIAYANPCFELWLYLHQKDCAGYLTTVQAAERMRSLGCCYTARKDFDPGHFMGQPQQEAIRRAEHLAGKHRSTSDPRDKNPWTDIHLLVRALLDQG